MFEEQMEYLRKERDKALAEKEHLEIMYLKSCDDYEKLDTQIKALESIYNALPEKPSFTEAINETIKQLNVSPCGDCSTKTSPCRTINCQYSKTNSA